MLNTKNQDFCIKVVCIIDQKRNWWNTSWIKINLFTKLNNSHNESRWRNAKECWKEILEIWNNIKAAFESNNFPTIKNTLCDWCYYKPICPEFNKNAPSTVELENCNEKIDEINETLEAINLVGGLDNLPDNSPLKIQI